jgi:ABC-type lipoprotein export system ATPase subunit
MPLIELCDYVLAPMGSGYGIQRFSFAISQGDVYAVEASHPDDATLFLRALATLVSPRKGIYRFDGKPKDVGNYRDLLDCKQRIGYIAPDAALISNLTLRQNLLLRRFYFENTLNDQLDDTLQTLCRSFNILDKLDKRPTGLNTMDVQAAIVIRELTKDPDVLLLIRPEDFIGHTYFDLLGRLFNDWIDKRLPMVLLSYDRRMIRRFANRKVTITNSVLTTADIKRSTANGQMNGAQE